MTNEADFESQHSNPLSEYTTHFGDTTGNPNYPMYPGYDWHNYSETVSEVTDIIWNIHKEKRGLLGIDLFNEVVEKTTQNPNFRGRTSHLLLSLFNRGYFGDSEDGGVEITGLEKEIYDQDNGQPINPIFKENQTDMPANIHIRKAILIAITSDMEIQEMMTEENNSAQSNLATDRVVWYKSLLEKMSEKIQIQPSGIPLK